MFGVTLFDSRVQYIRTCPLPYIDRFLTPFLPVRVSPFSLMLQNFDSADIVQMENDGSLLGVITHEMGHVIGIG